MKKKGEKERREERLNERKEGRKKERKQQQQQQQTVRKSWAWWRILVITETGKWRHLQLHRKLQGQAGLHETLP